MTFMHRKGGPRARHRAVLAALVAACLLVLGTGWVGYWTHRVDVARTHVRAASTETVRRS